MAYTFTNTERNNLKASVFETKSLLYLAANCKKYNDITVLTVDCFNDVAGMSDAESLWDVQAKGEKSLTPRKIGSYLITLYKNYCSGFSPFFQEFIFFMPQLNERYLKDPTLSSYEIGNFKEEQLAKVIEGLKVTAELEAGTDISAFLEKVLFVEDRTGESSYIKGIMQFQSSKLDNANFYSAIFKEIRDKQSALKNSDIENRQIVRPRDVLELNRHFTNQDLQVFVLNRLVGGEVFSNRSSLPSSYVIFTRNLDEDAIEDHIFEQNAALSRAFFDKSNQRNFWRLFAAIFKELAKDSKKKVSEIVKGIDEKLIARTEHIDLDSTRFLVAMIKDGLISDN
jgi:hypothetical protein